MSEAILDCVNRIAGKKYSNIYAHNLPSYFLSEKCVAATYVAEKTVVRELIEGAVVRVEFYSSSIDELTEFFSKINGLNRTLEILSNGKVDPALISAIAVGFDRYENLCRMYRIRSSIPNEVELTGFAGQIRYAENYESIRIIFELYFDPISERIPSPSDLKDMLASKQCIELIDAEGGLMGFYIFKEQAAALELRYIYICQKYRGMGFGGLLLNNFLRRSPTIKRLILWVFDGNINAINLYKKMGFEFDGLVNIIYRCKNDKQSTANPR